MFINPVECDVCHRRDTGGLQFSGQFSTFKTKCTCGNEFEITTDRLVLFGGLYGRLEALSNHVQYGAVECAPGIIDRVTFKEPFEFVGHVSLTPVAPRGFPNGIYPGEIMTNNIELLFGTSVVLKEALRFAEPIKVNWRVYGLIKVDSLPIWLVQFYSAMIQSMRERLKPALLDYSIAFELFVEAFLRGRLGNSCGPDMADYLLDKLWRIDERVKDLMKQVCGYRLSDGPDVYGPWDEYVRKPRNQIAHGQQINIDSEDVEKAHQAVWQAIKWIESLP
jgi:hypothetical protein